MVEGVYPCLLDGGQDISHGFSRGMKYSGVIGYCLSKVHALISVFSVEEQKKAIYIYTHTYGLVFYPEPL
jgi:hypothetical protein